MLRLFSLIPAIWAHITSGIFAGMRGRSVSFAIHVRELIQRAAGGTLRPPARPADALLVSPFTKRFSIVVTFLCLLLPTLLSNSVRAAVPGTLIDNTATATFNGSTTVSSNLVRVTTVVQRTPSTITFLQYAPTDPTSMTVSVPATAYSTTGDLNNPLPIQPVNAYSDAYTLPGTIATVEATVYHGGQPLIIKLEDLDQNIDPAVAEQVWVRISCAETGGDELLLLTEDGMDSGVFYGYVWTQVIGDTARDGILAVAADSTLTASYSDAKDGQDVSVDAALIDPYGFVFDSISGTLISGAVVTLWDVAAGAPANVFDDFGNPGYPATVTTGDPGLNFPTGGFRFPLIEPGREYRLDIQPPVGHTAPSIFDRDTLRNRFGSQFAIDDTASYGNSFFVNPGPAIHIDIPADPAVTGLWLLKESGKRTVSAGDFLQYTLNLENLDGSNPASGIILEDRLPKGFRYQGSSLRINGRKAPDPEIEDTGRVLNISIGDMVPSESVEVTYVVEISAGAELGKAVNKAFGMDRFGNRSNQATADVIVRDDFFRNETFLMGRVMIGSCEQLDTEMQGLFDARIYLEDGSYVLTDESGNYHFEGIDPGVHVVQLDLDTIPEQFEVVTCEDNTQSASRSYSQFVDLQGGTIWKVDFHLALKEKIRGNVSIELNSSIDDETATFQIPVAVGEVPLDDLRLSVILPDGLTIIPGTSRLGENTIAEPDRHDSVLTYRLADKPAGWREAVTLSTRIDSKISGDLPTKAILTFNSPEQNNQRTPMAENLLIAGSHENITESGDIHSVQLKMAKARSGPQSAETVGHRPGENQSAGDDTGPDDMADTMPDYDANWLANAEPGLAWLWPQEGAVPAIPSIKVAIKHPSKLKVTLLREGQAISPLNYEGTTTHSNSGLAVSRWRGIDVAHGDNNLTAIVTDHNGQQIEQLARTVHYSYAPVNAAFIPEQSRLFADGKNPIVIAVRLTDVDGYPVQQGLIGEYSVDAPYVAEINDGEINLNGYTNKPKFKVGADGVARVILAPTTRSGKVTVSVPLEQGSASISTWIEATPRDWILVGFAEGTAGYNTFSGNDVSLEDAGIDEHFYDDGQVKFFAKGAIKGEWLLTMAYDSDKPDLDGDSLYQIIDPDTYYPLYGDGTQQGYEASSARHLYVKLEREQFYALFGDMNTGLDQTELSRYNRTMNGFKSEMVTETFNYTMFAADTKQAFVKDEIRGDGTSGRYYLSQSDLVINSEIVTIETRDRFHSERILDTQTLARHTDYDIDHDAGSLFFKRPVPSRDERFNPVYIVVRYETLDSSDENLNYGGRVAALLFNGRVEAGATYVHEENGAGEGDLYGTDVTVRMTPTTTLHAEAATTDTSHYDDDRSGDAYLAEVTHDSNRIMGRAYYREQQEGFGLGQQNGSETGTRKYGLQGYYNLTPEFSLGGQAFHEDNLATDAERDVAEVTGSYSRNNFGVYSGLREARDSFDDGDKQRSTQWMIGGNWATPNRRLNLRADYEQSLRDKNENSDYPTLLTLGADYQLTRRISLFVEQEFSWGEDLDTDSTRAGLMATPWKGGDLHSTIEQQTNESGQRVFALFGLGQTWTVNQRWSLDASVDRSQMIKNRNNQQFNTNVPSAHGSDEDFTAVSFGSTYREVRWTWWNRIETRHADSEDKYGISTSVVAEPQAGVAIAAKALAFITDADGGARRTDGNVRLGMAYRPTASRWIVLDRLDFYFDSKDDSASDYDNWRIVNNLHANFKYNRKVQTSFYYGAKYVRDSYDSGTYSGYTDLLASETRYNIHKQWDVGMHGSMLHSWNSQAFLYGLGADIGFSPVTNTWISLGYNLSGFEDNDFSDANYTAKGAYIRFRVKFDQQSVREAAAWLNR